MNHVMKAVISASALLVASQANAADFILQQSPNFTVNGGGGPTDDFVSAQLKNNFSSTTTFSDNFYFSTIWDAALGNGIAGSSKWDLSGTNGLDFNHAGAIATGGLVITGYTGTQAIFDALNGVDGNTVQQRIDLIKNYIATTPAANVFTQTGDYGRLGNSASVSLSDVLLKEVNFYVITISGSATNGGNYSGNLRADQIAAVPEASTWAMMLVGFGALGFAMRRRRAQQHVKVSFA